MGSSYRTGKNDPVVVFRNGGFGLNTKNDFVMENLIRNTYKIKKIVEHEQKRKTEDSNEKNSLKLSDCSN